MRLNLLRACAFGIMSLCGYSHASDNNVTTEKYVNSVYNATHQVWPQLENVWDTKVYRKIRLIVADGKNAWAIDSNELIKIPYSEIQQRHLPIQYMHYQQIQWPDGRPTIYVSLGETLPREERSRFLSERNPIPSVFTTATHESFHFFVQANSWKRVSSGNESRATPYPVAVLPRFYRNNIIRALHASLRNDQNGLGHAKYWFNLWKKEYPGDAENIKQTDIDEGSAKYMETISEVLAQGHILNTPEYQQALIEKTRNDASYIYTDADFESYPIGALAGFILNAKKIKWQSEVEQGTPPLDILLRNVQEIKQPTDKVLKDKIKKKITGINNAVSSDINNFSKMYHHADVTKIFINTELTGSYTVNGGFFKTKSIPYDILVGFSSKATWPQGNYSITDSVAAEIKTSKINKETSGILILYAGKLPASNNGRLILKTKNLSLDIPYPKDIEKSKTIYLTK